MSDELDTRLAEWLGDNLEISIFGRGVLRDEINPGGGLVKKLKELCEAIVLETDHQGLEGEQYADTIILCALDKLEAED